MTHQAAVSDDLTLGQLLAGFKDECGFTEAELKFVEFAVLVGQAVVRHIMEYDVKHVYVETSALSKMDGFSNQIWLPDTPQAVDFVRIIIESCGLAAFCDDGGYWFFYRGLPKTGAHSMPASAFSKIFKAKHPDNKMVDLYQDCDLGWTDLLVR